MDGVISHLFPLLRSKMISSLCVVFALGLDKLLGEPRAFHPLIGFGRWAQFLEQKLYKDSKLSGLIALSVVLIPLVGLAVMFNMTPSNWILSIVVLYLAIAWHSLEQHAEQVRHALLNDDLVLARQRVAFLVSRDTRSLDAEGVATATVESVLENGSDAIFAAIFWFVLAGVPGVVLYRLVNTLDAMWGYKNERYHHFGWAAARLDDWLNYIPARLTALTYAMAGKFVPAINCWRTQGSMWKSPNAGPVMAAGAGSLGFLLGGPAIYHGELQARIALGQGRLPDAQAIADAQQLIGRSVLIWVAVLIVGDLLV